MASVSLLLSLCSTAPANAGRASRTFMVSLSLCLSSFPLFFSILASVSRCISFVSLSLARSLSVSSSVGISCIHSLSLSVCVSLSVCLSVSLFLSVSLSVSLCVYACLSIIYFTSVCLLLLIVYCSLFIVHCLLLIVYCLLFDQFKRYCDGVCHSSCAKEQRSLLRRGPPINLSDAHAFPAAGHEEIGALWRAATRSETSPKLHGSLVSSNQHTETERQREI